MAATILLFDLGGVLVDLGDPVGEMDLPLSPDQFWKQWLSSPLVHEFETGKLGAEDFIARFGPGVGVADAADFGRRLRRWRLPMFAGVEPYLRSLVSRHDIALLSNTNEIHWRHVLSQTDIFSSFAHLFLSYETGNAKPEQAAFLDVVQHFDCAPQDIVFLDDNSNNVAAAMANGLRARQVRGFDELKQALTGFGI
ncbi:MAG: HAD-IA family hydrolase [Gammaproteobacteria bacterium]|nr:HAD-IA family hydrolase [Gammaproteobacteria bacterium]MDH5302471.1 HAD-IA family hydrolase [Gammaproteobacteria bacterium]MDH5321353.1 HAD-IA family hydrolase [Gammaproteobacteria bacterium]